jgi:hypothetical protein
MRAACRSTDGVAGVIAGIIATWQRFDDLGTAGP